MKFFKFDHRDFDCLYNRFDFYILYKRIIPKYLDNKKIDIVYDHMIINKLFILTDFKNKDKIVEMRIDGNHPNVNPNDKKVSIKGNYKLDFSTGDFLKEYKSKNFYFDYRKISLVSDNKDTRIIYLLDLGGGYKQYQFFEHIIPEKLWYNDKLYQISNLNKTFHINKITINTKDDLIESVYLDSPHPNSNLITNEYCLPLSLSNNILNMHIYSMLKEYIKTYNFSNPHYIIWDFMNISENIII